MNFEGEKAQQQIWNQSGVVAVKQDEALLVTRNAVDSIASCPHYCCPTLNTLCTHRGPLSPPPPLLHNEGI